MRLHHFRLDFAYHLTGQGATPLRNRAKAFLEYLQTDDAMKVFEEYGFAQYRADDEKEAAEETDADTAEETEATEETK